MVIIPRIRDSINSTGTSDLACNGSPGEDGWVYIGAQLDDRDYSYLLLDGNGIDWEVGVCYSTWDAQALRSTVFRSVVMDSTNGGGAISLSNSTPHSIFLNKPAFMANRPSSHMHTSVATSFPDGVWTDVVWSTEAQNTHQVLTLWSSGSPSVFSIPGWTDEIRFSGNIAVEATAGGAGRWYVRVVDPAGSPISSAQFDEQGSTTDIVTVPFSVRFIHPDWHDQNCKVQVLRSGVAGILHPSLSFVDVEVMR